MSGPNTLTFVERDKDGRTRELRYTPSETLQIRETKSTASITNTSSYRDFLTKVFLPAGFPQSVTPDYLRYQVLNAAQAFCNSLAGLLASRAVLEGIGVGNPAATSTQAMLLSVTQDVFSRLATIVGAYRVGTSLVPEAKTYRLMADVLNDVALISDTLSPRLDIFPGARVLCLCTSAVLRALCGVLAGGSKAAITLHFANPVTGMGDVGDLNAKDSSKETVLALFGMLLGSLIVPRVTSAPMTYTLLFILITLHLAINYIAVRGLVFRTLNRQRASIAWLAYRSTKPKTLDLDDIAKHESILDTTGTIRDLETRRIIGEARIGPSLVDMLHGSAPETNVLVRLESERYLVCFDPKKPLTRDILADGSYRPFIHICFKHGYTMEDQLKGWAHAIEICRAIAFKAVPDIYGHETLEEQLIRTTYNEVNMHFKDFMMQLKKANWKLTDLHLMPGHGAKAVLMDTVETSERKMK